MNLKKEFDEFRDDFKQAGILTKLFLLTSFVLSVSSLASLSSTIVEWYGFILQGIKFYQSYFVDPVASAASKIGLNYSRIEIHAATVASICMAVGMRVLILGQQAAFRIANRKYGSNLKSSGTPYQILAIIFPVALWITYGISDPPIRPWVIAGVTLLHPLFIITPKLLLTKFGWEYLEKGEFSYFKSYYAYLFFMIFAVCSLAAVNLAMKEIQKNESIQLIK